MTTICCLVRSRASNPSRDPRLNVVLEPVYRRVTKDHLEGDLSTYPGGADRPVEQFRRYLSGCQETTARCGCRDFWVLDSEHLQCCGFHFYSLLEKRKAPAGEKAGASQSEFLVVLQKG